MEHPQESGRLARDLEVGAQRASLADRGAKPVVGEEEMRSPAEDRRHRAEEEKQVVQRQVDNGGRGRGHQARDLGGEVGEHGGVVSGLERARTRGWCVDGRVRLMGLERLNATEQRSKAQRDAQKDAKDDAAPEVDRAGQVDLDDVKPPAAGRLEVFLAMSPQRELAAVGDELESSSFYNAIISLISSFEKS